MINPRLLVCLFLALALGATPLLAQPEPSEKTTSSAPAKQTPDKSAPAQQAPAPKEPAQKRPAADSGDSPFDYHSSEEISEDLPVSFPVDI